MHLYHMLVPSHHYPYLCIQDVGWYQKLLCQLQGSVHHYMASSHHHLYIPILVYFRTIQGLQYLLCILVTRILCRLLCKLGIQDYCQVLQNHYCIMVLLQISYKYHHLMCHYCFYHQYRVEDCWYHRIHWVSQVLCLQLLVLYHHHTPILCSLYQNMTVQLCIDLFRSLSDQTL